jgi:hypothetical protein
MESSIIFFYPLWVAWASIFMPGTLHLAHATKSTFSHITGMKNLKAFLLNPSSSFTTTLAVVLFPDIKIPASHYEKETPLAGKLSLSLFKQFQQVPASGRLSHRSYTQYRFLGLQ